MFILLTRLICCSACDVRSALTTGFLEALDGKMRVGILFFLHFLVKSSLTLISLFKFRLCIENTSSSEVDNFMGKLWLSLTFSFHQPGTSRHATTYRSMQTLEKNMWVEGFCIIFLFTERAGDIYGSYQNLLQLGFCVSFQNQKSKSRESIRMFHNC